MPANLNVDALVAESTLSPYTVTIGGRDYELPHAAALQAGVIDAVFSADTGLDVLAVIGGSEFADAVRELPLFAVEAIVAGWQEHSGITVGESAASSDS